MNFKKIIATSLVFILSLTVGFSVANQSRKILHADEVKKTTANYNSITSIKLNKASLTISGGKKISYYSQCYIWKRYFVI